MSSAYNTVYKDNKRIHSYTYTLIHTVFLLLLYFNDSENIEGIRFRIADENSFSSGFSCA